MPIIREKEKNTALGFWREGVRHKDINPGLSFLSFFKIIESQFKKGDIQRVNWTNSCIKELSDAKDPNYIEAKKRIKEIFKIYKSYDKIGKYLFDSGKCAITHASMNNETVNPNILADKERLLKDLPIMEALAGQYIKKNNVVRPYKFYFKTVPFRTDVADTPYSAMVMLSTLSVLWRDSLLLAKALVHEGLTTLTSWLFIYKKSANALP